MQRLNVYNDPLEKHLMFIEIKDGLVIKVIFLKEFAARLVICLFFSALLNLIQLWWAEQNRV